MDFDNTKYGALTRAKLKTEEDRIRLAGIDGAVIQLIENPSEEVQLAAVRQHFMAVSWIKEPSRKVQMEAVCSHPQAIAFLPEADEEMQLAAVRSHVEAFEDIHHPTQAVKLEAVSRDGLMIRLIEPEEQTDNLKMAAVQQNGLALEHIPQQSPEIQWAAVLDDGMALRFVKDTYDEEMVLKAIRKAPEVISHIEEPTKEMQRAALQVGPSLPMNLSEVDPEVEMEVVNIDPVSYRYLPAPHYETALAAVKKNGLVLEYVESGYRTEDLVREAIKQDGAALAYLNDEDKTEELCLLAVKQDGTAIQFVPNPSEEVAIAAVSQNYVAISELYGNAISETVQLAAVHNNGNALLYIDFPSEVVLKEALTHGQESGNARLDILIRYENKFSLELLDSINPRLREGLNIVKALDLVEEGNSGWDAKERTERLQVEELRKLLNPEPAKAEVDLNDLGDLTANTSFSFNPVPEVPQTVVSAPGKYQSSFATGVWNTNQQQTMKR